MSDWKGLNQRQQMYLQSIFEVDQAQERMHRMGGAGGQWDNTPASVWRWIPYNVAGASLYGKLRDAHLIDPGTGSTFESLEQRGYIERKWTAGSLGASILWVYLTPQGRKFARANTEQRAATSLPVGSLQEWHWRALAKAYVAGLDGVPAEGTGYGRIGWNTWVRLRDYRIKGHEYPLIEQRQGVCITPFGAAFYDRTFVRYRELYPGVAAPAPTAHHDPFKPFVEVLQDHRTCRVCRGEYLVAVTRIYQQDHKWIWSVEEHDQRIPGEVTSKYDKIEQCVCQEEEIQELDAPLLMLLDRLIENGWQMGFVYHHWFYDLDSLVGGVASGRVQRWYDVTHVKQKLLPLLDDPDLLDERNILKGNVRYCWNEDVGHGSIYPQSLEGSLSLLPVAITRAQGEHGA